LRLRINELDKDGKIVVHCNKGTSGNAAQNILINHGFKNVLNLSGGYSQYKIQELEGMLIRPLNKKGPLLRDPGIE